MADDFLPVDDEELRRSIRAEIEARDRHRQQQDELKQAARSAGDHAGRRRRIYQEELRRYYQNRPGYREVIREDGEIDWIPEIEARQGEKLFDEVLEDPAEAKKRLGAILSVSALLVAAAVVIFFLFLSNRTGAIQVVANVPGAQVVLDATPLDFFTNATVKEIPAGEHVVTVQKAGYIVLGEPIQRIKLHGGRTEVLSFTLEPKTAGPQEKGGAGSTPEQARP